MFSMKCGRVEGALGGLLKGLLHTVDMKEAVGATVWVQAGRECGGRTCKAAPAAVMSASGVVAGHRVKLSTQVSRLWEPQEYDRGSATLVRASSNLVEIGAEGAFRRAVQKCLLESCVEVPAGE